MARGLRDQVLELRVPAQGVRDVGKLLGPLHEGRELGSRGWLERTSTRMAPNRSPSYSPVAVTARSASLIPRWPATWATDRAKHDAVGRQQQLGRLGPGVGAAGVRQRLVHGQLELPRRDPAPVRPLPAGRHLHVNDR